MASSCSGKKTKKGKDKKSSEVFENAELELKEIPLKRIIMNPENPNVMDENMMGHLKESFLQSGYIEPAVVIPYDGDLKPDDGKKYYFMIDGEHRVLTLLDLGIKKAMVIVAHNVPEHVAYGGALTFNKFKGKLSAEKIAEFLLHGANTYGKSAVLAATQLDKNKYDEYVEPLKMKHEEVVDQTKKRYEKISSTVKKGLREINARPIADLPRTVVFSITSDAYVKAMETLGEIDSSPDKAFVKIITYVRKNNKEERISKVKIVGKKGKNKKLDD